MLAELCWGKHVPGQKQIFNAMQPQGGRGGGGRVMNQEVGLKHFVFLSQAQLERLQRIMAIQGESALVGASLEYESTTIKTEDEFVKEMRHMQPLM